MRRNSREMAFKIIFESFFNENPFDDEVLLELKDKDQAFCQEILTAYKEHSQEIQDSIKQYLKGYKLDRVYKVDLALVYEAITEIEYLKTPAAVAINEILEISKIYSTENSPKFLNGLLSSYINGDKQ